MPTPGTVWAADTWDADAWAANTWADSQEAAPSALRHGRAVNIRRSRARRMILLPLLPFLDWLVR